MVREKFETILQKMAILRGYKKTVREKWKEIIQETAMYGEKVNRGAGAKELERLNETAEKELHVRLPREYIRLLKAINGLEYNGFILYGIDEELSDKTPNQSISGLIESNKMWRENEWEKPYVFLGESSISWYVYDGTDQKYYELDNPSGTVCEEFADLESMMEKILTDALM